MFRRICFLAILSGMLPLQAVELVKDGKPVSEIVVPQNLVSLQINYAAQELRDHIRKISGAELPITSSPSGKFKNLIHLGESEATKKAGVSVADLKEEGFKIIAKGDSLYIVGHDMPTWKPIPRIAYSKGDTAAVEKWWHEFTGENWEPPWSINLKQRLYSKKVGGYSEEGCGTLFGVYEFLEQLGVRWFMPDEELGTVIPEKKDIAVADGETKKEPHLKIRILTILSQSAPDWSKRLRFGGSRVFWCNHSINHVATPNKELNPEYFDTVNGKIDTKGCKENGRQLLISPELQKAMTKYLDKCFEAFPELKYGSVGEADGYTFPGEIATKAGWDKISERGQSGRMSDYFWGFVNRVAADLKAKYPDRTIMGLAYSAHRLVPNNIEKFPENVGVTYCQTRAVSMMPARQDELGKEREEWFRKITGKEFFIWDYYLIHGKNKFPPMPVIFTKLQQDEAKKLYGRIQGEFIECAFSHDKDGFIKLAYPGINHLTYYLQSKLYWDKDLDMKAFMDDYCGKFYGPAKNEMLEFFEFSEKVWMRPESRTITQNAGLLKPDDVSRYFDILSRAKAKAGDGIYGKRVAMIENEMKPLKNIFDSIKRTGPDLRAYFADNKPQIDGDLESAFWVKNAKGGVLGAIPMRNLVNGDLPKANGTDVAFRWYQNNSALLVGITCFESNMDKLTAKIKQNDHPDIFNDDHVEIYIETPEKSYFKIAVNSNGAVWDECTHPSIEQPVPLTWDSKVKVGIKKYSDRWTMEIQIPAADLGGRPIESLPWGVNVCRQRIAGENAELYAISPTGKPSFAVLNKMGNLFTKK